VSFSPLAFLLHNPTQLALGRVRVRGGGAKPPQYNQPTGGSGNVVAIAGGGSRWHGETSSVILSVSIRLQLSANVKLQDNCLLKKYWATVWWNIFCISPLVKVTWGRAENPGRVARSRENKLWNLIPVSQILLFSPKARIWTGQSSLTSTRRSNFWYLIHLWTSQHVQFDEALLLCQTSENEWVAWIPDHGEAVLNTRQFCARR